MNGRPLRFLSLTLGGWTVVRVALLWPTIDSVPALIDALVPPADAAAYSAQAPRPSADAHPRAARPRPVATLRAVRMAAVEIPPPRPPAVPLLAAGPVIGDPREPPPLRLPDLMPAAAAARVTVSFWGIARAGPAEARPGSQLGGSQAGVRAVYALGASRRLALSGRLSSALDGTAREAAIGLDWQPAAPIHLIAERRLPIGAGRSGAALFAVAGIDPHGIGRGVNVEAYAQAGAVLRDRAEGFADGAARVTGPVAAPGGLRLDIGVGAWGGAQRGASRLDIGPTAALRVPVGTRAVRVTLDWRQRIAGSARPGSGPALTIGGDF